ALVVDNEHRQAIIDNAKVCYTQSRGASTVDRPFHTAPATAASSDPSPPMISATAHHFSPPAIAFKITSCTFIIRSISADETVCSGHTPRKSHPRQPHRSHAN